MTGIGDVVKSNSIEFIINREDSLPLEILKLCANGDIYVEGRLVCSNEDVGRSIREYIKKSINTNRPEVSDEA